MTTNNPPEELLSTPVDRRTSLRILGKTGAAALALGAFGLTLRGRQALAQDGLPQKVVDVLNFALTLEYLEDEFYRTGLATRGLIPSNDRVIFSQIGAHETAHVALLRTALGSAAVSKPNFDFTAKGAFDTFTNYETFKALAQGFEDTGVRAYKGQVTELMEFDDVLTTAVQIHSVEARHASEVRRLRGAKGWITGNSVDVSALQPVYAGEENTTQGGVDLGSSPAISEAFDEPLGREEVLAIAGLFLA